MKRFSIAVISFELSKYPKVKSQNLWSDSKISIGNRDKASKDFASISELTLQKTQLACQQLLCIALCIEIHFPAASQQSSISSGLSLHCFIREQMAILEAAA